MRYLLILIFLSLAACATRYSPVEDYKKKLSADSEMKSRQTVLLFLVDGLSTNVLNHELGLGHLPNLKRHFLGPNQPFFRAHSVFPSLTFPNISSLLAEKPVHKTGHIGNLLVANGRLIDFEAIRDRSDFGNLVKENNVFTRLQVNGYRSVSLDYGLGEGATIAAELLDLKAGLAAELRDYLYLDKKRIDSLKLLLSQNSISQWPEFVFIHLVGLDFVSHRYGHQSSQAYEYLELLDHGLKEVFELLRRAEKTERKVISILTADHGFSSDIKRHLKIEDIVAKVDRDLKVLNEGRLAALYSPQAPSQEKLQTWTFKLLQTPGIDIVSFRKGNRVQIKSLSREVSFVYVNEMNCGLNSFGISIQGAQAMCLQDLPLQFKNIFHPFFIENLAFYFQAEKYPDVLVIPAQATAFHEREFGLHGGPTLEETVVPLLLRNASLESQSMIPSLSELLRFM